MNESKNVSLSTKYSKKCALCSYEYPLIRCYYCDMCICYDCAWERKIFGDYITLIANYLYIGGRCKHCKYIFKERICINCINNCPRCPIIMLMYLSKKDQGAFKDIPKEIIAEIGKYI